GIGAHGFAVILPLGGGSAKVVAHIAGIQLQVGEVLLAELLILVAVSGDNAVIIGLVVGHRLGIGSAHVDGAAAVAEVDVNALVVVLDHVGGQSLESHLSGVLTGQLVGQHQALGGDAGLDGVSSHVDGPGVAGVVLDLGIVAQSNQQHL